jgi:hypothetical protein
MIGKLFPLELVVKFFLSDTLKFIIKEILIEVILKQLIKIVFVLFLLKYLRSLR